MAVSELISIQNREILRTMKHLTRIISWATLAIYVAGIAFFVIGYIWTASSYSRINLSTSDILWLVITGGFLICAVSLVWKNRNRLWQQLGGILETHTDDIDSIPEKHLGWWIALAAGVGLFTELALIRFHSSSFQLFAYFKNISLLSCFLGLGIGYSRGALRPLTTPLMMPLLAVQIATLHILRFGSFSKLIHNPIPENVTFGLTSAHEFSHLLHVYGFLILVFSFNILCFIPLGQLASRLMMRQEKLVSYSWNLVGSLLGIILFTLLSAFWTTPPVWFAFIALCLFMFVWRQRISLLVSAVSGIILVCVVSIQFGLNRYDIYSPYQILTLINSRTHPNVLVNNIFYQDALSLSGKDDQESENPSEDLSYYHYAVPYMIKPNPDDVLIVGSGMGNDVSMAVNHAQGSIDAVDIDPAIIQLGKILHPDMPYQSEKVTIINTDARAYIRQTNRKYDLIVYGFLDSHTAVSSRSGVRLDSYVYTVEAFREARSRLKEDGVISLSFSFLTDALNRKIFLMLQEAFDGKSPRVYRTEYLGGHTFVIGESNPTPDMSKYPGVKDITAQIASSDLDVTVSTDDWPFLYMAERNYPFFYMAMLAMLFAISVVFVFQYTPGSRVGFSYSCFFLGAGFMLIETKGITELALVFGSTWVVVSIVIAAILVMAFLSNLLVIKTGPISAPVIYSLLLVSVLLGLLTYQINPLGIPLWQKQLIMTAGLTLPVFFSGIAFSGELKRSQSVAAALSSNLLGAMVGGFLEYNSMYFGFHFLYYLAFLIYALAFISSLRQKTAGASSQLAH